MKELMNNRIVQLVVLVIAVVGTIFLMMKCNSNSQDKRDVEIAVYKNNIEHLNKLIYDLAKDTAKIHKENKQLTESGKAKDKIIAQNNRKIINVTKAYEAQLAMLKEVDDDSAVAIFLDNAECGPLPIMKYGDSGYVIPICPIRNYNDLKVGFDMQIDVNSILRNNIEVLISKSDDQQKIINNNNEEIRALNKIIVVKDEINENEKGIGESWKDKYKAEKRKVWIVGATGAGIIIGILALTL